MTENPIVIDGEVEDLPPARPFFIITHKTPLARTFEPFGASQDLGANVNPETAALTLWWASQSWAAQVLENKVALPQLLAPTAGFVATLDPKWLHRQVGHLRKRDIPAFYAKHPGQVEEHPQVILSTGSEHNELVPTLLVAAEDLAAGIFPAPYDSLHEDSALQLDQPINCAVEVRYWIAYGELTAACPYRMGVLSWESNLFLEMLFNAQGRELIAKADEVAQDFAHEVDGPPGYAIDLGVTLEGTVSVLRAWPTWAADPYSADNAGVLQSLVGSHDFDNLAENDIWRWNPDPHIYDRSHLADEAETEEDPHHV